MGRKQKLLDRLLTKPKDFRWNELESLLKQNGYQKLEGSGSRVKFYLESPRNLISLHKPHPGEILKDYQINYVIKNLKKIGVADGND
ncbi:MAG: type II toxin-antitoxin system HicA family toxin [Deltaproteobacteria bacterium]|uniref:type II toxin-antitoxin system HicA family toxin n=1 Tax=Desulfobacula sp. TaxID=2593537 RepID=UPI0019C99CD2|nr:type II toxin-antitoxin system HicA family toxin [Candidatus Desulfobacula maris]MBL6993781.1 type II toxin-antitoxin system HicA family toxin [Desulfobacula sp.]